MSLESQSALFHDPEASALKAGLQYQSDDIPGISRKPNGKGFKYLRPDGQVLRDKGEIERIRKLAIPPAWTDVWISADPQGHLAVTGRDARGRKQYRYNPDFVQLRDSAKYAHLVQFARLLPQIRKTIASHMAQRAHNREKVLATIVYLLENTRSRIGNERYAKDNQSFGLTTLRNRHVKVKGETLQFEFKGKSGKIWRFNYQSRRVAKVIRGCQELPGQQLFEYRDDEGVVRKVGSSDVNAYLREISGADITAKDFRTWIGTVEVAKALDEMSAEERPSKAQLKRAIEQAANTLGNTVAVCRKCYVHPAVTEAYEAGRFKLRLGAAQGRNRNDLSPLEKAVLRLLTASIRVRKAA